MKKLNLLFIVALLLTSSQAFACDSFKNLSSEELKEYRNALLTEKLDPLDKLFAFNKLSCSDNPNIRAYAIKHGFKNSVDPLVKNQVLLIAMMQKTRIDIELGNDPSLSEKGKEFFAETSGVYSRRIEYKSQKEGCLSLSNPKVCNTSKSVFINGDKVEYNYPNIVGQFQLSPQGELVGFLKYSFYKGSTRIPAVIKLF